MEKYSGIDKIDKLVNNQDCMDECLVDAFTIHPLLLRPFEKKNTCSIFPIYDENNKKMHFYKKCNTNDIKNNKIGENTFNNLIPSVKITEKILLNTFYNILSYNDAVDWIEENNNLPILTRFRVIKYTLLEFKNDINIIDNSFIDIIVELIKKIWIVDIYDNVHKYMKSDNTNIIINKNFNTNEKNINKVEKINVIIEKYGNKNNVYKFLNKYISDKSQNISNSNMKKLFINNIINNIML